ncbi:MAG TPA: 5'/3'-nucleotidase SurE, partial [Acidimicrobiales bacterium]|nr:5'/3'-nucleotidase SurE [Acidimicrobiales bacterium]
MRVLVSNDDGIAAPGLAYLARALVDAGHDVLVAAPISEASGAGAGVGPIHMMGEGILVEEAVLPGL